MKTATQTLKRRHNPLSDTQRQLQVLNNHRAANIPSFSEKMQDIDLMPLKPTQIDTLQINVGKMCNQVCKHCHVDAGPDRKEIMSWETMSACLKALVNPSLTTVDITGGAPEMNPHFRRFVAELCKLGKSIIVRCNLTIIMAARRYWDLPDFFKKHKVNVVSSLPYFNAKRTDAQRGSGVFEKSIKALQLLNDVGYGQPGTGLKLDLVYNPSGAFLPDDQKGLEEVFKKKLEDPYGITFNNLFSITNLPVSRFLDYLISTGKYNEYMEELANAFNPTAAYGVMCRNTISVGWDGFLYDCDFNQMLGLKIDDHDIGHIDQYDNTVLQNRKIIINQHCYGCTAGAGSSCGGSLT